MKTSKFFLVAAVVCTTVFTSCSKEDNPTPQPTKKVISFESATLNADGYWWGNTDGEKYDSYGSEAYACKYVEQGVTFPVNLIPSWSSFTGYAISSRTETGYKNMIPDEFNNITGRAHSGKNFCVVYTFGETIDFGKAVTLKGFWYTNNSWTVDAILNGDSMSPGKFETTDWLSCYIMPTPADGSLSGARYEISLAKDGDYVKEWKYCDLSGVDAFKNISSIAFSFDGTKKNDYGVTTPTYICIDDIEFE